MSANFDPIFGDASRTAKTLRLVQTLVGTLPALSNNQLVNSSAVLFTLPAHAHIISFTSTGQAPWNTGAGGPINGRISGRIELGTPANSQFFNGDNDTGTVFTSLASDQPAMLSSGDPDFVACRRWIIGATPVDVMATFVVNSTPIEAGGPFTIICTYTIHEP